jgi:glycosyltransferase involved in cell wall biosynthesis
MYTEPEWAFGSIHYELTKHLYSQGINATVLNWERSYNQQEIQELARNTDYFHSSPYGINLLIKNYGISPEQCIATVHAKWDLDHVVEYGPEFINQLHGYTVVSEWLAEQSRLKGIDRTPMITPVAINYDTFHHEPSQQLRTVGFAGAVSGVHLNIKRPWLVEQAVKNAGLELKLAHGYHNSYVTMAGYYPTVDALLVASTEEGAGLPALEASAAGRLVISTPVGLWQSKSGDSGHTVPIDERRFVEETTTLLEFYRDNADAYREKCLHTQQHARTYDWSQVIHSWIKAFQ